MTIEEFAADNQVSRMTIFRWMKMDPPLPHVPPPSGTGRGQVTLIPVAEGRGWVDYHAPVLPRGRRKKYYLQ